MPYGYLQLKLSYDTKNFWNKSEMGGMRRTDHLKMFSPKLPLNPSVQVIFKPVCFSEERDLMKNNSFQQMLFHVFVVCISCISKPRIKDNKAVAYSHRCLLGNDADNTSWQLGHDIQFSINYIIKIQMERTFHVIKPGVLEKTLLTLLQ